MKPLIRLSFSPASQLLFFAAFILAGLALGGVLSVLIGHLGYGIVVEDLSLAAQSPQANQTSMLMWINSASQVATFLLPSVVFMRLFGMMGGAERVSSLGWFAAVSVLWMVCSTPLIEWLSLLNRQLIPAGSMLERFALPAEERAMQLTKLFLDVKGTWSIGMVVLHVALVPALCEEVAFRGVLQPLLQRGLRNIHTAIWLAALVFSAIHFQLYGFLPRLVLGAGLGYLVWWSGSIWPAVLAHFANNALGIALYLISGGALEMELPWWIQLLLLAGFGVCTWILRQRGLSRSQRG